MPGGRGNRRDVKHLSKNRFSRLDADIASSYVDDDEEERPRPRQGTVSRVINMLAGRVMHGAGGNRRGRKDEQTLRSAGGVSRNTEMVHKVRGNRLRFLDYAAVLVSVTKFLKVLDLSNNQDGSPVQPAAVHVQSLDDDEITTEPPCRPGFYGTDNLRVLVERFLVEYFKLYDGEEGGVTRKNLVQAYDQDNSSFTITIAHLKDMSHEGGPHYAVNNKESSYLYKFSSCYNLYIRTSHNVLCEERWSRNRSIRTYRGAMDIAVALSKLPITNHYTESFIVDTHLISEELLAFTVQGLFEDGKFAKPGEVPQLSFFSRSIAVISDMLYLTGITPARVARYKLMLNKAASAGAASVPFAAPVNPIAQATNSINGLQMSSQPSDEIKRQMVAQFCKDSGMIPAWSEKCLIDSDWNYQAAGEAFLASRDSIPKEAFAPTAQAAFPPLSMLICISSLHQLDPAWFIAPSLANYI
ncbi:TAP protein [Ancylostoma ceylanicum]|uniref:TAP protein n=1 Tax=Ancylostoma ceylanicum TaxID=53326 RepID=A0A0D6L783_9BILA|nr:TAP protein [Ancylostoma ceylanicum]